jgi:nucleotide-binding universal stress UspA family protein
MESDQLKSREIILVPVDYSDHSIQACRYALKIAKRSDSNLLLFHAFYSPAFDLIELSGGLQTQQQLRTDVTEKLIESENVDMEEFIEKLYKFDEFQSFDRNRISSDIKSGLAKDEILNIAEEIQPKMVVMGTKGADKKASSILGSITEIAIRRLKVPVFAIPENYKFIGEHKLNKIVYLTDFDESDFLSIKKLISFTRYFNLSIHCIHIGPSTDKWESLKMNGLKDYFQKAYKQDSVECHILENKPDLLQAIDNYISENGINILSLTHRKRRLIEKVFKPSVTKKVFYHSEIPLLVFHS